MYSNGTFTHSEKSETIQVAYPKYQQKLIDVMVDRIFLYGSDPDGNGGEEDRCPGPVVPEKNLWHQIK